MTQLKIPTREQCLKIFNRYILFSNVEHHSVATASVAMHIAAIVKKHKHNDLNLDIVFATSLFHDLGKALVVNELDSAKYGYTPLTAEQEKIWKLIRSFNQPFTELFEDLKHIDPNIKKVVHETDVSSIIIGALFPDFIPFLHQIGGTNNAIYLNAGPEIKIMHYSDWRVHHNNIIDFKTRLDYLRRVYWKGTEQEWKDREKKELALEKELFTVLPITPELDLKAINQKKSELFGNKYDLFEIKKIETID